MKVDEMPAGREMDALIAEKVMGHRPEYGCFVDDTYNGECVGTDGATDCLLAEQKLRKQKQIPGDCKYWRIAEPEPYSTDIAAAWEVVEKIKDTNMDSYKYGANSFELSRNRPMQPSRLYACRFNSNNNGYSYAETASLAICRAALKTVGVNEI